MAHVLDTFVIELGLDPTKFNAQQRQAVDQTKKQLDEFKKQGDQVETASLGISEAFSKLKTQAIGAFAIFTGAKDFGEFVSNAVYGGAAVGRLSRAIGQSAQEISRWQGAAREFGSTGEAMASSFKQLSDVFTAWQVGGPEAPGVMQIFRTINTEAEKLDKNNARQIDSTKTLSENYLALAANLKIIREQANDPNLAAYLAGKIPGMDAGQFDLLASGADKVAETLKKVKGYTDEEADAAGRLQRRWDALKVSAENLGLRALFGTLDFAHKYLVTPPDGQKPTTFTQPSINSTPVSGGFTSQRQKEAFIRAEAEKRGIDPNYAMAVAKSEGFDHFVSTIPGEQSFGAFQLHVTPGGRGRAVGDQFREKTGLDPSDPKNEAQSIMFALDWAKNHGWHDFHGAANGAHLSNWSGIDRNASGGSSNSTSVTFTGPISIQSGPNASAGDIAAKLKEEGLRRAAQANQNFVGAE